MKGSIRILAALFFSLLTALTSSASSLLCSAGPTSQKTDNNTWQVIYTCTIPANTVSTNKSVRLTLGVGAQSGADGDYEILLNGVELGGGSIILTENYFLVTVMNTGSTTGEELGIFPDNKVSTYGTGGGIEAQVAPLSGLSWANSQTLELEVYPLTGWVQGQMFMVELVN